MNLHYLAINESIRNLMLRLRRADTPITPPLAPSDRPPATLWDLPRFAHAADVCLIYAIEKHYAEFCTDLLQSILVPYWDLQRSGCVEDSNVPLGGGAKPTKPDQPAGAPSSALPFLQLAEELIVVRYVALIRAVLVNIRYLMLFVSAAFVLAIIAWNSYPFQPHRLIDWCFTLLFFAIGTGFVWVFAQMHRNPILSRITDTKPNELGTDFYIRIISFGAVPLLTWLAYQFPEVGGKLLHIVQPSLKVLK
jgi:hypothetical protein